MNVLFVCTGNTCRSPMAEAVLMHLSKLNNNTINKINIDENIIEGYMNLESLIIDSNLLGYVLYISKNKFEKLDILKEIKNILIDLIN